MFENGFGPLWQDLRGALRNLVKHPLIGVLAVVSLALAIAGNGVVFSLVSAFLLHSFDFEDPETIAFVWQSKPGEFLGQTPPSPANFVDFRERSLSFDHWTGFRAANLSLTGGETPEPILVGEVSASFFPLLGVEPIRGRAFDAAHERRGNHRAIVLEHDFWTRRFGADPDLVGGTVELGGSAYSVLGVLPPDFEFLFTPVQAFVPLVLDGELSRGRKELLAMARLRPGIGVEEAEKEMQVIAAQLAEEYPEDNRDYGAKVLTLPQQFPGEVNTLLFLLLQGLLIMVLLIACINVANLLLARGQQRQRELALRAALGAGRRRLVRQLLTESLVLALCGGLLGLFLGWLGIRFLLSALASQLPASLTPSMDAGVVAFTVLVAALAGLTFGLVPAFQAATPNLSQALAEGGRGQGGGRRRRWLTRGLVVAEVAGALIMLSGAGLLVRSFLDIKNARPGFEQRGLLTFQLSLPEDGYGDDAAVARFYEDLQQQLAGLPGVRDVTLASFLPRTPLPPSTAFYMAGESTAEPPLHAATFVTVGDRYLETLQAPLLQGRPLSQRDHAEAPPVVVVNRAMAERFWPEDGALGTRITLQGREREVVGIAGNVQQDLLLSTDSGYAPIVYLPVAQLPSRGMSVLLRTEGEPKALLPSVRDVVQRLDTDLSVLNPLTLEEYTEQFFAGMTVFNQVLGLFGVVALVLAAVGIYGVIAFSVSQRTREIGIRMALGARRGDVLRQVTWEGMLLALIGFAVGLPGVWALVRGLRSVLQGLGEVSPAAAGWMAALLLVVALAASLLPARRAAHLDPVRALRRD